MSDPYERDIELATAADEFLSSPLGKHVTFLAGQEIDRCMYALKSVDPEDKRQIQKLQDTIRRNETLGGWLAEILHTGDQAKKMTADQVE